MKICKYLLMVMRGVKLPNNLYKSIRDTIAGESVITRQEVADEDYSSMAPSLWPFEGVMEEHYM